MDRNKQLVINSFRVEAHHSRMFYYIGIAAGNILWDLVKGVSKGIEDSYKESEAGRIKHLKAKLQKRIGNVYLFIANYMLWRYLHSISYISLFVLHWKLS